MQIDEFYFLGQWLQRNYVDSGMNKEFQKLIDKLNSNIRPNQAPQAFDENKQNLLSELKKVDFSELSEVQMEVLKKYQLEIYFGPQGSEFLEDCLYRNSLDSATALAEIQKQNGQINQCYSVVSKIGKDLEQLFDFEDTHRSEPLIRVHFRADAEIGNIVDYKDWMTAWYDIGRGFALLLDTTPEDIKIVSTDKGSIIITLGAVSGVVLAMSKAILKILDSVKRVYEIRAEAEKIKNLRLKNTKLALDLLKEVDGIKDESKADVVNELMKSFADGKDGEVKNGITKAVERLVLFLDKGGNVDFYLPPVEEGNTDDNVETDENPEDESLKELSENIQQIRALESKIQLIDYTETDQ